MFQHFYAVRHGVMLSTVLLFLLGVVLVGWPGLFIEFACYILGGVLVAFGAVKVIEQLKQPYRNVFVMGFGIVVAAIGIVIITNPQMVSSIVPLVFGLILLFDGISSVRHSFDLHRYGDGKWVTLLILSLITVAFGVLVLLHPYGTAELAFRIMGIALIYNALSDAVMLHWVGRAAKEYGRTEEKRHAIDVEARPVDDDE